MHLSPKLQHHVTSVSRAPQLFMATGLGSGSERGSRGAVSCPRRRPTKEANTRKNPAFNVSFPCLLEITTQSATLQSLTCENRQTENPSPEPKKRPRQPRHPVRHLLNQRLHDLRKWNREANARVNSGVSQQSSKMVFSHCPLTKKLDHGWPESRTSQARSAQRCRMRSFSLHFVKQARDSTRQGALRKLVGASWSAQVALRKLHCASCSAQVAPRKLLRQVGPCKLLCANCAPCKLLCASCSVQVALCKLLCVSCSAQVALGKALCANWSVQVGLRKLLCATCSAQVALRKLL